MSLGTAILVIVLLALLIYSSGFRKVAAIGLVVLVVAAVLVWLRIEQTSREQARKEQLAKTYIKHTEIEIVDPKISFSTFDGTPSEIVGRIRNKSRYGINSIELKLVFKDCLASGECETVGESEEEIRVYVPPGQSRDFEEYISGPKLSAKGKLRWHYTVKAIIAQVE